MARYIDADILLEQVGKKKSEVGKQRYTEGFNDAISRVRSMISTSATVDVSPNSEGKWEKRTFIIFDSEKVGFRCSECNTTWDAPTKFCPNCGAKMKGGG